MTNITLFRIFPIFATLVCLAFVLGGCGGGGAGTGSVGGGSGTLAIHLSDAGGNGITAANLTITKIEAHIGSKWETVFTGSQTVNLLDLRNTDMVLGSALVTAGNYTQVRIFVSNATVTDATGVHSVTIPSGLQTGIKVNLNYTVNPNVITDILLDFNVGKSFILQGNGVYRLQPVIPAVIKILSGTATGTVSDAGGLVEGASVTAIYTAGSSYPLLTEVNGTFTQADGRFKVWALLPGTYTFTFSYVNPATSMTETATVTGVSVAANANSDLGAVTIL